MADVQSNIQISIDTTQALASIKNLQRQISAFHSSMAKGGAAANAVSAQMQQTLLNSINAGGKFSAQIRTIKTTTESFTDSLQKNKFSIGEYFRYAGGASKTFGRLFKTEFDTINKVARENVKDLQTQYIRLGRDASGAMKAIAVRPLSLDMTDLGTRTQIAAQKQALLNQLLKQGSTNLLNFGKNTQWAGRQLMVGFTIPLMAVGSAAAKTFMDMETQAIKFRKVYGDLFTPEAESKQALKDIQDLGKEFTRYGVAVSATVGVAAEAAAAGFAGIDLQRQTEQSIRLSILGQVDYQKALETTISVQNAFGISSDQLATSIDFLNAVENQTVLSLDDVTTAIPKAAPIVQQLGGDIRDLAFFMTAMKEGGINASEGANALKSGLASMINPTGKAVEMLESFGINVRKIVVDNKGDLKKTVIEFATALNQLDPLNRAQAIEQMFGKFQFARLSTLFANVTKEGTQASRVLDLAGASVQELATLSEKELGMTSESAMNKFKGAVESLKLSLIPLGEEFLKAVTPVAEFVTKILDKFNGLSSSTKKVIVTLTAIIGGLGPVFLMTFGLLANGLANIIKGFTVVKSLFNKTGQETGTLGTATKYMTAEQRNAAAVAASLDQVHTKLRQTFTSEAAAVNLLTQAYQRAVAAQATFMPVAAPMGRGPAPTKRAKGKPAIVGGTGNKDSELALLMPGETVIPTKMSQKYGSIINAMIADKIPGYKRGQGTSKNPGKFKSVDIPGSYDASHFGGRTTATGQQLLNMVDGLTDSVSVGIRRMVESFSDEADYLTREFTTFDNRVVAQDTSINRNMKYKGEVPTSILRENLTGKGFAEVRDIQLQKELTDAGMSIDEYKKVNKQITSEIVKGFDALGSKTTVTSDELDKLLRNSYDAVAKTDQRVEAANNKLKAITTVTNPKTSSRLAITPQSYTLNRADSEFDKNRVATRGVYALGMDKMVGPGQSPYSPYARIGVKAASASALGLSLNDTKRVYDQFSKQTKIQLSLLKDDVKKFTDLFVAEAEKAGIKSGNSYKVGIDKSTLEDIYVESRDRKSPHPLAPKDGKDDARAYVTARDKELAKASKQPRIATKGQGPAPIGATPLPGMTVLPIVPKNGSQTTGPNNPPRNNIFTNNPATNIPPAGKKTVLQTLLGLGKKAGSKVTGMGGGFGLLGLNMGLSMTPDFAGKGIAQSTLTGANLGMFLGPKGTAVGSGIGAAVGSLSALNAKIKEYGEVNKSAFTISNSLITAFGDKVLDTSIKVTELSKASIGLRDKFGLLSPEVQAIIDDLKKLPEDDPLAIFIKSISKTGQSLSEVTGNLRSKLTTDIAIGGLDPENAQKYVYTLMVAAGKANEFGAVWKSISKDVVDASTATEASFNKVGDAVNIAGGSFTFLEGRSGDVAKDYDELRDSAKTLSDQMFSFFGVLSNGAFTYDQIQERLQAFGRSSIDAKTGVLALQAAVKASNDPILIERFALIERIIKESGKAATATAADYTMMHLALEMLAKDGKNIDSLRTDLFPDERERALARRWATDAMLMDTVIKGKDIKKYADDLAKERQALNDALGGNDDYKDYEDGVDGLSASSNAYLKILEKEITGLEAKRDAQKNANDEIQRQIDLETKLKDLAKESVLAKISGDYIKAANLQQQAQNVQVEFNLETELKKKDAEIARLKARAQEIEDGAKLTRAEKAKIPKNKVKAASGGMIRGAGTPTSDSIPAYLSNGEYVIKADSVKKYGTETFDALNAGRFAGGGLTDPRGNIMSDAPPPAIVPKPKKKKPKISMKDTLVGQKDYSDKNQWGYYHNSDRNSIKNWYRYYKDNMGGNTYIPRSEVIPESRSYWSTMNMAMGGPVGHRHGRNAPGSNIFNIPLSAGSTATMYSPATGLASDPKFKVDSKEAESFLPMLGGIAKTLLTPFTPSEAPDASKQSEWSKLVRNFGSKVWSVMEKTIPGGKLTSALFKPLHDSAINLYSGDAKWNDLTNIGSYLFGTGAIKGGLSGIGRGISRAGGVAGKVGSGIGKVGSGIKSATMGVAKFLPSVPARIKELRLPKAYEDFDFKLGYQHGKRSGDVSSSMALDPKIIAAKKAYQAPLIKTLDEGGYEPVPYRKDVWVIKGTDPDRWNASHMISEDDPLYETLVKLNRAELDFKAMRQARTSYHYGTILGSKVKSIRDGYKNFLDSNTIKNTKIIPRLMSNRFFGKKLTDYMTRFNNDSRKEFEVGLPLSSIEEALSTTIFHGGNLKEITNRVLTSGPVGEAGKFFKGKAINPENNWFGLDLFATSDKSVARGYVEKNGPLASIYEMMLNTKSINPLDIRHGTDPLSISNPKFLREYVKALLKSGKTREAFDFLIQEGGSVATNLRPYVSTSRAQSFSTSTETIEALAKSGLDSILHSGGFQVNPDQVFHNVLAMLDPEKIVSSFTNIGKAEGGIVKKYAMGGLIKGPGTGISDSIQAGFGYAGGGSIRVSNGEYVVKASSVKDYGVKTMDAINNGTATVGTNSGGTVYNINMPITSNNADAEGVANEVMRKLKLEVSKNNKTNRVGL